MIVPRLSMGLGDITTGPDPCTVDPESQACLNEIADIQTVPIVTATTPVSVVPITPTSVSIPSASVLNAGLQQSQMSNYLLIGGGALLLLVLVMKKR